MKPLTPRMQDLLHGVIRVRAACAASAVRPGGSDGGQRSASARVRAARGRAEALAQRVARHAAADLEREHAQRAAAAAVRDERARRRRRASASARGSPPVERRACAARARRRPPTVVERAGIGRRDRAHEVVDPRARPASSRCGRPPACGRRSSAPAREVLRRARRGARRRARAARGRACISAATVTLSNTSRAVSSGRIGTAVCATMSPASGFSAM